MKKRLPSLALGAGCVLTLVLIGCRAAPTRRPAASSTDSPTGARSARELERSARWGPTPRERARRLISASRLYLDGDQPADAIRCLYRAKGIERSAETAGPIHRLLGEAYLARGQVTLAKRYLRQGVEGARGAARQETLARLVVCVRESGDEEAARAYEKRLALPRSEPVRTILSTEVRAAPSPAGGETLEDYLARRRTRSPGGATRRSPQLATPRAGPAGRASTSAPLRILPRTAWAARPVRSNVEPMRAPTRITIHHTGPPRAIWTRSPQGTAREIRLIQRYHQRDKGWADIAYHFIIGRDGTVWQGRPLRYQGAHAGNRWLNARNVGIVLLGDYSSHKQHLTSEQRRSLDRLLDVLMARYSISPQKIYTHREIAGGSTACPGPEISRFVSDLRRSRARRNLTAMAH